jgi:SAM-dependent methyltransferase
MQIPRPLASLRALLVTALAVLSAAASAQSVFKPEVGQRGKDVIWVPTPDGLVERMLRIANVGPADYVIDLGSGDGRIVIAAAKDFGARAKGIEFNPDMVALAQQNAAAAGVSDHAEFARGDLYQADLSPATVITMYLLPSINLKLRPKVLELKPGTRIVSHDFDMGDWKPDETTSADGGTAYLWIVPAKVDGPWQVEYEGSVAREKVEVIFKQQFQMLEGRALRGQRMSPVSGAIHGEGIQFNLSDGDAGERVFVGRVHGASMEGTIRLPNGEQHPFTATR